MAGEMSGHDGTKQSGLVTDASNKPPRMCSNCIWMGMGACGNAEVMSDPELVQLKQEDGRIAVEPEWCSNNFQSKGNAIIYAVRHGETQNNKDKKFRGWIEVPLNGRGKEEAKLARKYLEDKGIKRVFCSDLGRAIETAKLVLPSKRAEKNPKLRPWDVGVFSGKERSTTQETFNKFIDNPEVAIPDGESLKEFSDRMKKEITKYIKEAQEDGPILIVFHSSNCIQMEKIVEGKDELGRPEDVDRVLPGGIMCVLDQGDAGLKVEVVFGSQPEKPGNYGS